MNRLLLAGIVVSSVAFAQTDVSVKTNSAGGVEVKTGGKTVKVDGTNVQVNEKKVKVKTTGTTTDVDVETPEKAVGVKVTGTGITSGDAEKIFSIQGAGGSHTHTCVDGQDVAVEGSSNTLVLHGPCKSIAVQGASNSVETDIAGAIAVQGSGNSVKWRAALKGKKPAIAKEGLNNSVDQLK